MTVRRATAADVDALVEMGLRFLGLVYPTQIRGNGEAIKAFSLGLMKSPDAAVYVAEVGDQIVGMLAMMRYDHPMSGESTVSEVAWWVNPEHRGAGIKLFRIGEAWARESGATVIQMIAPTPEVERFYMRVGYEPVERTFQRRIA